MNGRKGGEGGLPVEYEYDTINKIELYDLSKDISETKNVADQYPGIVLKIQSLGDKMRNELGDKLTDKVGTGTRLAGEIK